MSIDKNIESNPKETSSSPTVQLGKAGENKKQKQEERKRRSVKYKN